GCGSSGVQIVGAVVDDVEHLTLFQRTAQWIAPQGNPLYTEDGQAAFRQHPALLVKTHEELGQQFDIFANSVVNADSAEMKAVEQICVQHLEESVKDPVLREKLRPSYRPACKRLVVSSQFYRAVQEPSCEVITDA